MFGSRRSAALIAAVVMTLTGASSAGAKSDDAHAERHCVQAACFTIPVVQQNAMTKFRDNSAAVANVFGPAAKSKHKSKACRLIGAFCGYADTSGFMQYEVFVTSKSYQTVTRIAFKKTCGAQSTTARAVRIDMVLGKTVQCSVSVAKGSKLLLTTRVAVWRYGPRTYLMDVLEFGRHPADGWPRLLNSVKMRWSRSQ